MRAVNGNREYRISDEQKEQYINEGFDIYDDDGKKIAVGKGKDVVSQKKYNALLAELEKAKESSLSDSEVIPVLTEYAQLKGIDIGQASTAKGIYKKIKDSSPGPEEA